MSRVEELSKELINISEQIITEDTILNEKLSAVDKELSDIYHYIEFSNFNAAQGYKAYKELQAVLKKRRAVKNDIKLLSELKANFSGVNTIKGNCIRANINITTQAYTPRVRDDLFENSAYNNYNLDGIDPVYTKVKIKQISDKTSRVFNNLFEAIETIPKTIDTPNTRKKIAKKLIKACTNNTKYGSSNWEFVS